MKVTDTHGRSGKYGRILEEYFHIVPLDMFLVFHDFLFDEKLTIEHKIANYEHIKADILKLKELFKQKTIEINKMAHKEGYSNRLEATLAWDQIPKDKYESFLNNIDNFVSLVMSDEIPIKALMEKEKDWNIFNTPYPLGLQIPPDKFEIPNEVLSIVSTYDQRVVKYKDRIDIIYNPEVFYSSAYYNKDRDVVEIRLRRQRDDIYRALSFVRELGYALNALELVDKGGDPHTMPKYASKYNTIARGFKFVKSQISPNHQKVLRYNLLSTIASTLFEIDIFTNERQDYDKAYARAVNRCYPMTHQTENPFYVFYKRFVLSPMDELMSSMIEMELYLKDAEA